MVFVQAEAIQILIYFAECFHEDLFGWLRFATVATLFAFVVGGGVHREKILCAHRLAHIAQVLIDDSKAGFAIKL